MLNVLQKNMSIRLELTGKCRISTSKYKPPFIVPVVLMKPGRFTAYLSVICCSGIQGYYYSHFDFSDINREIIREKPFFRLHMRLIRIKHVIRNRIPALDRHSTRAWRRVASLVHVFFSRIFTVSCRVAAILKSEVTK